MMDFEPQQHSRQSDAVLLDRNRSGRRSGTGQPPTFFPAGSEIYAQGEKCRNLYEVVFGAVRIYRLMSDGRRQISAFHLPGEIFGFEPGSTHHFFAEAICGTGIRALRPSTSQSLADLLPMALESLQRAHEQLLVLGRQNAIERVAAFFVEMSERQGGMRHIELPMPRSDIADYLGLTIETVSRVFSRLKLKGVIRLSGLRNVELVKLKTLQDLAA